MSKKRKKTSAAIESQESNTVMEDFSIRKVKNKKSV